MQLPLGIAVCLDTYDSRLFNRAFDALSFHLAHYFIRKVIFTFSIPSPTSKRTNDFTSPPLEATNFSTVISGSLTNGWSTKAISALNFCRRPTTIFQRYLLVYLRLMLVQLTQLFRVLILLEEFEIR